MAITAENELDIRKALATTVELVPEAGYVIPSARYCSGLEEYWAAADPSKVTREAVETSLIAATWIYPVSFVDDFSSGCADKPLVNLTYELYMFRQYGLMRADESDMPDVFDSKVLIQHNAFIAGWLGVKEEFQGKRNIAGFDVDFQTSDTTSVVQIEDIRNQVICEFVPGVVGFAVRMRETVKLLQVG